MRAFIAIDIPEEMQEKIREIQEGLREFVTGSFQKGNFHLTLKFLGEIKEAKKAIKAMESLKDTRKFAVHFSGLGAFPNENYIRVIWIGVSKGSRELEGISRSLNESLGQKERYVPHLTIARVRNVSDKEKLLEYLKRPVDLGEFQADKVHLYKSELTPEGAKHTRIHTIELE